MAEQLEQRKIHTSSPTGSLMQATCHRLVEVEHDEDGVLDRLVGTYRLDLTSDSNRIIEAHRRVFAPHLRETRKRVVSNRNTLTSFQFILPTWTLATRLLSPRQTRRCARESRRHVRRVEPPRSSASPANSRACVASKSHDPEQPARSDASYRCLESKRECISRTGPRTRRRRTKLCVFPWTASSNVDGITG